MSSPSKFQRHYDNFMFSFYKRVNSSAKYHVIWLYLDSGSCRQSEVTSAVIQKTATRRSKQTRQHEQHKHKHGSTDAVPPTGWVRECRTELEVTGVALQGEMLLDTTYSLPHFVFILQLLRSHLQEPRMPCSPNEPGIVLSLNLRAASCTCCHREKEKKRETGWRFRESWNFV